MKKTKSELYYIGIMLLLLSIIICVVFRLYIFDGYLFLNKGIMADNLTIGLPGAYNLYDYITKWPSFWSWNMGIGSDRMVSLGDPFSLILIMGGKELIPQMYIWSYLARLIFSSVSMYLFLKYFDYDRKAIVVSSICYSLCGFSLSLGTNITYVTAMVYLPIVFLGLERWIINKRDRLLLVSLTLTSLYFYYIFYSVGIFCAVYLVIRMRNLNFEIKEIINRLFRLAVMGVIVILISAISILPSAYHVFQNPRISGNKDVSMNMGLWIPHIDSLVTSLLRTINHDILGNPNLGNYIGVDYPEGADYFQKTLYVSAFFQVLLVQVICIDKANRRKVLEIVFISIITVLFPFFSYAFNFFATINTRWMFVFSLLQGIIIAKGLDQIANRKINKKGLYYSLFFISLEIPLGIMLLSIHRGGIDFIIKWISTTWKMYVTVIGLYALLLILYWFGDKLDKHLICVCFFALFFLDIYCNYKWTFNNSGSVCEYSEENKASYNDSSSLVINDLMEKDEGFYRINKDFDSVYKGDVGSDNDALVQGYFGLKSYNSLNNANYIKFLHSLNIYVGYPNRIQEFIDNGLLATDVIGTNLNYINGVYDRYNVMSYLCVKYYLTRDNEWNAPPGFEFLKNSRGIIIYENKNSYPLCYVNDDLMCLDDFNSLSFENREKALLKYTIVDEANRLDSIEFYTYEQFENETALKKDRFSLNNFASDKVDMNIMVENNNSYLSFSMPYDPNWHVIVDGKEMETEIINVALLGVKVDAGYHNVELVYRPLAVYVGIGVSIVTVILLMIINIIVKYTRKLDY